MNTVIQVHKSGYKYAIISSRSFSRKSTMDCKIIFLCVFLALEHTNGFVKREVELTTTNNIADLFKRNVDRFRDCVDKAMAAAASEVDEKQLQPIFNALGEQVDKFSKVFEILTAPPASTSKKQ